MSILADGLHLLLGLVGGALVGLPSLSLVALAPWAAEAIGQRRRTPIARQRRHAAVAVTLVVVAHVVWMWFLAGWVIGWLGWPHPRLLQAAATLGALAMGCLGWILVCCALEQMIRDPGPAGTDAAGRSAADAARN